MTVNSGEILEYEDKQWVRAEDYVYLQAENRTLAAEVARLRALMIEMSKHRCSHIIQHSVDPTPEEYEAWKGNDVFLGPTITYTCGIHNINMSEHDNRCPECDRTADSASAPRE